MYMTLIFFSVLLLPIPVIIRQIGKRKAPYRAVLEGVIAGIAGAVFFMILASVSGNSVSDTLMESVRIMAASMAKDPNFIQAFGSDLSQEERIDFLTQIYQQAAQLFPSTICIFSTIISYIEYLLFSKMIKPGGLRAIPMDKLRELELPRNIMIGWLLLLGLSWIITKAGVVENDMLYTNINTLFVFAFCLQGISVLFMYCYKKGAPKVIAVIIIIFFFLTGYGKIVLMLLGFADLLFRLKERMR